MSDHRAIFGVTTTLQRLLKKHMVNEVTVTTTTPTDKPGGGDEDKQRINLYLYRIAGSPALANQQIPGTGHPGAYGHPPLSLELHYLLTGFSKKPGDDPTVHELMGDAMQVFHDHPLISPRDPAYRQTGPAADPEHDPVLDPSLNGAFEQIKIYPDALSLDDLSKIWTSLECTYRLSAAYKVTVIQIESARPRREVQLVGEPEERGPRVRHGTMDRTVLARIGVIRQGGDGHEADLPYLRVGDDLVVYGERLDVAGLRLFLGPVDVTGLLQPLMPPRSDRLRFTVPNGAPLQPGVLPLHARVPRWEGDDEPGAAFRTNSLPAMLVPRVTGLQPATVAAGSGATITLTGRHLWNADQECRVLVSGHVIPGSDYAKKTGSEIEFALPDDIPAKSGRPVRVRVGEAESIDPWSLDVT